MYLGFRRFSILLAASSVFSSFTKHFHLQQESRASHGVSFWTHYTASRRLTAHHFIGNSLDWSVLSALPQVEWVRFSLFTSMYLEPATTLRLWYFILNDTDDRKLYRLGHRTSFSNTWYQLHSGSDILLAVIDEILREGERSRDHFTFLLCTPVSDLCTPRVVSIQMDCVRDGWSLRNSSAITYSDHVFILYLESFTSTKLSYPFWYVVMTVCWIGTRKAPRSDCWR